METVKNELSSFIDDCFKKSVEFQKENVSLAGESVSAIFKNVTIKNNTLKLDCEIKGKTGEIYDSYSFHFDSVIFPYYYLEILRLALICYWSGNLVSKKDRKRYLFILEYGETNKFYLNRSLKYLFYCKKIVRFNR